MTVAVPKLPSAGARQSRIERQLIVEANKAEGFGKPLAAMLMRGLVRTVPQVGELARLVEVWPGDLAADAVTFRLSAGLHALARSGRAPGLAFLYSEAGDEPLPDDATFDRALLAALETHTAELGQWIARPTQTNEVARVAGLIAVLMALNTREAMPFEVLELGASAGLNLNFPHYACHVGDAVAMAPDSPVVLAPEWRGQMPAVRDVAVLHTRGVDLTPLDPVNPDHCARLESYVWPGEMQRARRLAAAIALARRHPPSVERGHAGEWLEGALAGPQLPGVRRVVFHSMVMQYADPFERAAIDAALAKAGAVATQECPLVRISMEWRADRRAVELRVTTWDGGADAGTARLAAHCHPYGEWIEWFGLA